MANISGNNADNVINGTADDDRIVGQGGNDTINGDAGDDFILWRYGDGDDIIDGGDGFDTARFNGANGPGDNIVIEDVVVGGNTFTRVSGDGFSPFSNLVSNVERITVSGEAGDDTLTITATNASGVLGVNMGGGDGQDILFAGPGVGLKIVARAGDGDDQMTGGDANDRLLGEFGQDMLNGGAGDDFLSGGDGDDLIIGGTGNDALDGNSGQDTINGGAGNDLLIGNDGDDVLNGEDGNDVIHGGQGQDILNAGDGALDILLGQDGDDQLNGGAERDVLVGGQGQDVMVGGAGNDSLNGQTGDDVMTGGAGNDVFIFTPNFNHDVVTDFEDGSDRLRFFKNGVADITDLTISDLNGDLLVSVTAAPQNDVLLLGQAGLTLDAGDFIFFP